MESLNDLRIASPCPASWAAMRGDDRARFCDLCSKHVYDISGLTTTEIRNLIETSEGAFCARLHRRSDGTVITADCPVGLRAAMKRRCARLIAGGLTLVAALRIGEWTAISASERPLSFQLPSASDTLYRLGDWANSVLGVSIFPGSPTMGAIVMCPPMPPIPSGGITPGPSSTPEQSEDSVDDPDAASTDPESAPMPTLDRAE